MCALVALLFLPLLINYLANLWSREAYQFFPLAIGGVILLAYRGWAETPRPFRPAPLGFCLPILALAFALESVASWLWSPWVGAIALLPLLAGLTLAVGGWPLFKKLAPAGILLLTIILPPLKLDEKFTLWLQHLTSIGSSHVLARLGVHHRLMGNVIEIPGHRLLVEEACSGIKSVLFMTAACLFFAFWRRRKPYQIVISVFLVLSFVMAGNIARIVSGTWLEYFRQINILTGARHEVAGVIMLASYLAFIVLVDFVWGRIDGKNDSPVSRVHSHSDEKTANAPRALRLTSLILPALFAVVGLFQVSQGWRHYHAGQTFVRHSANALPGGTEIDMPFELAGWERLSSARPAMLKVEAFGGINSQVWQFQKGSMVATISFDYPFAGYHDVQICYEGNGCVPQESALRFFTGVAGVSPYQQVMLQKDDYQLALWYSTIDQEGHWMENSFAKRNLLERFREQLGGLTTTYRVQMVVNHAERMNPADLAAAAQFYEQVRERILPAVLPKAVAQK